MPGWKHGVRWLATVCIGVLAGATFARASMVEALDFESLVAESQHVVLAQVVSQRARHDERGQIVTEVTLQVEESAKGGAAPGSALVIRHLGGVVDSVGMRVEGEPSFRNGEVVMLFCAPTGQSRVLRAVGMAQGALRIVDVDGERYASSAASGLTAVVRGRKGVLTPTRLAVPEPRPVAELMAAARDLAQRP